MPRRHNKKAQELRTGYKPVPPEPAILTGEHVITPDNFAETMRSIEANTYGHVRFDPQGLSWNQCHELLEAVYNNRKYSHEYSFSASTFADIMDYSNTLAKIVGDPNFVLRNEHIGLLQELIIGIDDGDHRLFNYASTVLKALARPNCALTELRLRDKYRYTFDVSSLAKILVQPDCKIEILALPYTGRTDEDAQALSKACTDPNCKITTLDLSYNSGITDNCVDALIECLHSGTKLRNIDLRGTSISATGNARIIQALQSMQHEFTFAIDWPRTVTGATPLIDLLEGKDGTVLPPFPKNFIIDIGEVKDPAIRGRLIAAIQNPNCPHNLTIRTTSQELIEVFAPAITRRVEGGIEEDPSGLAQRNFHLVGTAVIDAADTQFYSKATNARSLAAYSVVAQPADARRFGQLGDKQKKELEEATIPSELVHLMAKVWPTSAAMTTAPMYKGKQTPQAAPPPKPQTAATATTMYEQSVQQHRKSQEEDQHSAPPAQSQSQSQSHTGKEPPGTPRKK